jgi:hypothetical protein
MVSQADVDAEIAYLTTDGCNKPQGWLNTARNLLSCAELSMRMINSGRALLDNFARSPEEHALVSRSTQTIATTLMLYAFAIECLMKAHYVVSGHKLYDGGVLKQIPGVKPNHDLLKLCRAVELFDEFEPRQIEVLDKLTLFSEVGRYPGPANSIRYGHKLVDGGKGMKMKGIWGGDEYAVTHQVLEKLYQKLGETMPVHANVLLERNK